MYVYKALSFLFHKDFDLFAIAAPEIGSGNRTTKLIDKRMNKLRSRQK